MSSSSQKVEYSPWNPLPSSSFPLCTSTNTNARNNNILAGYYCRTIYDHHYTHTLLFGCWNLHFHHRWEYGLIFFPGTDSSNSPAPSSSSCYLQQHSESTIICSICQPSKSPCHINYGANRNSLNQKEKGKLSIIHIMDMDPPAPEGQRPTKKQRRRSGISKKRKGGDRKSHLPGAAIKTLLGTAVLPEGAAVSSASPSTTGDSVGGDDALLSKSKQIKSMCAKERWAALRLVNHKEKVEHKASGKTPKKKLIFVTFSR